MHTDMQMQHKQCNPRTQTIGRPYYLETKALHNGCDTGGRICMRLHCL